LHYLPSECALRIIYEAAEPFCGEFIGRNTLTPGAVKTSSKVGITLDTPYGALAGATVIVG
jgi:hypothetical protein